MGLPSRWGAGLPLTDFGLSNRIGFHKGLEKKVLTFPKLTGATWLNRERVFHEGRSSKTETLHPALDDSQRLSRPLWRGGSVNLCAFLEQLRWKYVLYFGITCSATETVHHNTSPRACPGFFQTCLLTGSQEFSFSTEVLTHSLQPQRAVSWQLWDSCGVAKGRACCIFHLCRAATDMEQPNGLLLPPLLPCGAATLQPPPSLQCQWPWAAASRRGSREDTVAFQSKCMADGRMKLKLLS